MRKKLLIYLPTYSRFKACLQQAKKVHEQISNSNNRILELEIHFYISINGDYSYDKTELSKYANSVINNPVNYGGNVNISLGFIYAKKNLFDFLWIIGDDEPIGHDAVLSIASKLGNKKLDLIVGSKKIIGNFSEIKSYMELSKLSGGTPSFISSTVYSCDFSLETAYEALTYEFTSFPHLVVINKIFESKGNINVEMIPLDKICKVDERIYAYPKVNRRSMGARDSTVFFGKPLALMSCRENVYKKQEMIRWWLVNWHRVSMYYSKADFRGKLLIAVSWEYKALRPLILISILPIWKLKDLSDWFLKRE